MDGRQAMRTLVIDNRNPLDGFPVSPDIRGYLSGLTPRDIEQRLGHETARQGKTAPTAQSSPEALTILLVLLAGFLMAQEKDRPGKPITDMLNDFIQEYVAGLPAAGTQDGPLPEQSRVRPQRVRRPYNLQGLAEALEEFEQGDAEEQGRTLSYLETAIDRDRPGQRRIFGRGVNPAATDEAV
jgi:hypothetical protein